MDYHVFIVSRIKELVDGGLTTEDAVARGIRTTAGTVTSGGRRDGRRVRDLRARCSTLDIKQMGVGLAVAVLLDATIIRGVLLPATMKLLGDWNWYLPRWLALAAAASSSSGRRAARPARGRAGASQSRWPAHGLTAPLATPAPTGASGSLSAFVLGACGSRCS